MVAKSYEELLALLEDTFDGLIAPYKISRDDGNKFHLIFKAFAKGLKVIWDAVLSLKYRFDPNYCADDDFVSTAKITGNQPSDGVYTALKIVITNTSATGVKTLKAGEYRYTSGDGNVFLFDISVDIDIAASTSKTIVATSSVVGSFPISASNTISVTRTDGASIDNSFTYSCLDNAGTLGKPAETPLAYRTRLLSNTERQSSINRIQERIRRVRGIFECNCIFNSDTAPVVYDGMTLAAKELLIIITGNPSPDIAGIVVQEAFFKTHRVNDTQVIYHDDDLYVDGHYPVYYAIHGTTDFALAVSYQYRSAEYKSETVEARLNVLLSKYADANSHEDVVTEQDIYDLLSTSGLSNVRILNVNLFVSGVEIPYLSIPKTRLPHLTATSYTAVNITEA